MINKCLYIKPNLIKTHKKINMYMLVGGDTPI